MLNFLSIFTGRFLDNHRHYMLNVHQNNWKQDIFRMIAVPATISTLKKKLKINKLKKSVGECQFIFLAFLFLLWIFSFHYLTSLFCVIALSHMLCKNSGNTTRGSGRGPSFRFLLLPSWHSISLIQSEVRGPAAHLDPAQFFPSICVSMAGHGCVRKHWTWLPIAEKPNVLNGLWYDQPGIM